MSKLLLTTVLTIGATASALAASYSYPLTVINNSQSNQVIDSFSYTTTYCPTESTCDNPSAPKTVTIGKDQTALQAGQSKPILVQSDKVVKGKAALVIDIVKVETPEATVQINDTGACGTQVSGANWVVSPITLTATQGNLGIQCKTLR